MADVLSSLWDGVFRSKHRPWMRWAFRAPIDSRQRKFPDELARAFALCSRVLGNQRGGLYRPAGHALALPRLMAKLPTAVIASPQIGKRPPGELVFARACRRELAARIHHAGGDASDGLESAVPACGQGVQSAPDRQAHRRCDDVETRAGLPREQKAARPAKEQPDLDPAATGYRLAIRRAIGRAALLVSGDLLAARNVLLQIDVPAAQDAGSTAAGYLRLGEGESSALADAESDLADLCAFFIAPQNAALFDRLHPR